MAPHLTQFYQMSDRERAWVRDLVSRLHYPMRDAVHRVRVYGDYHCKANFDWSLKCVVS